jgi:hypothetical protein
MKEFTVDLSNLPRCTDQSLPTRSIDESSVDRLCSSKTNRAEQSPYDPQH